MADNTESLPSTDAKYFTMACKELKTFIIYCEDVVCKVWELFRTVISLVQKLQ